MSKQILGRYLFSIYLQVTHTNYIIITTLLYYYSTTMVLVLYNYIMNYDINNY